jgi:xanthine dehydrogenase YagS FAD-binding subunit
VRPFRYVVPDSLDAAVEAAAETGGCYLGGGTNLVDLMRLGVARPATLVEVGRLLPATVEVVGDGGLLIGAGLPNSDLAADPRIRRDYPVLSQALLAGASGQLRNMATTGGNLLQRTRCLYFQDVSKPCNKRQPGSGCPARTGIHRDLAILGGSENCIATHSSDLAVALAALDAQVYVQGQDGRRTLSLDELYRLPGDDPSRDTTLAPADLIVGVELPPPIPMTRRSAYRKVRDRASYAFAVSSVAAGIEVAADGRVLDVRIALGAVAPRPWRARIAEADLRGALLSSEAVRAAIAHEMQAAEPLPDNAFKAELSWRVAAEVLIRLAAAAPAAAEEAR